MNTFKCTEKCFHRARLFELEEFMRSEADEVQHFLLVSSDQPDKPGKPDKPPGKPTRPAERKAKAKKKADTADILN